MAIYRIEVPHPENKEALLMTFTSETARNEFAAHCLLNDIEYKDLDQYGIKGYNMRNIKDAEQDLEMFLR